MTTLNPPPSGLTNTPFAQVQTSIESAVTIGGTVYQNFNLHQTTVLDVRHEFATLIATTGQVVSTVDALPTDTCTGDHILDLATKCAAMGAAISRTTGSIKNLPGPVSHEDGVLLLNSYKELQVKIVSIFTSANIRLSAVEQAAPGIGEYTFNRHIEVLTPLTQALSNVLPPSMNAEEPQLIQDNIQSVRNDTLARLRASMSNN